MEYASLCKILTSFLDNKGIKRRRLLVHGERGIGKSICVRAVIYEIISKRDDCFVVIVEGNKCKNPRDLLREISDVLSEQIKQNFSADKDLLIHTSHLTEIIKTDCISRSNLRRHASEIEASAQHDVGLLDFIKLKLGIRGAIKDEEGIEESSEIIIDDSFRIKLLKEVLCGINKAKNKEPLLFVDNLDQITESEKVVDFIKLLTYLDEIPVVITMRSEFISTDIHKEHKTPILFEPLESRLLMEILNKRLSPCPEKEKLLDTELLQIASDLSNQTGNPFAFLSWIEYLCWHTNLKKANYINELKEGYIRTHHATIKDEVEKVAKWYLENNISNANRDNLKKELDIDDDDIDIFERQGIIIPDDILRPKDSRRYTLSPMLKFFQE
jgi:Cdc6-like AAA superfamily ATPase